jgi:hypothetical protein
VTANALGLSASAVLTLTAVPTRTTQVVAYAWADQASASVGAPYAPQAAYSYNASGGAVAVTHSGTGIYEVSFAGLTLDGSGVQISAYGSSAVCVNWSATASGLAVECFGSTGNLVDSQFTVSVLSIDAFSMARTTAYAWANEPSTATYSPDSAHSYNSLDGGITASRSGTGVYSVTFSGLPLMDGNVQVDAYNTSDHCNVHSWGSSAVNVDCFDATGTPADARFTVTVTEGTSVASSAYVAAYVLADQPSNSAYSPTRFFNSTGQAVQATRTATGAYAVSFPGQAFDTGIVEVGASSGANLCSVTSVVPGQVSVQCDDLTGAAADCEFVLSFTLPLGPNPPQTVAYALAGQPTLASYDLTNDLWAYSAAGGTITAARSSAGVYTLTFAALMFTGDVQVTPYGSAARCDVGAWSGHDITVYCYDNTGAPVDSAYTLSATDTVSDTGVRSAASTVAYAFADQPSAATYTPSSGNSYNSTGGTITVTRASPGVYGIAFGGLDLSGTSFFNGGNVQISSDMTSAYCGAAAWGVMTPSTVGVNCYDNSGAPVDAPYTVLVTLPDTFSTAAVLGYAWADQPAAASYVPNATYSYSASGGAITATRSSAGQYEMSFAGLSLGAGHVKVSGHGNSSVQCNPGAWGAGRVSVSCFDSAGAPADSDYDVVVTQ